MAVTTLIIPSCRRFWRATCRAGYIWFGISDAWRERVRQSGIGDVADYPRYRFRFDPKRFLLPERLDSPYPIAAIDECNVDLVFARYKSMESFWS